MSPPSTIGVEVPAVGSSSWQLSAFAIKLEERLKKMSTFIDASAELHGSTMGLSDCDFVLHFPEIVTLIEISKHTLEKRIGPLYMFSHCPFKLSAHKSLYYDLLRLLKQRRYLIRDPALKRQLTKLIFPLSTFLVIEGRNSASPPPRGHGGALRGLQSHRCVPHSGEISAGSHPSARGGGERIDEDQDIQVATSPAHVEMPPPPSRPYFLSQAGSQRTSSRLIAALPLDTMDPSSDSDSEDSSSSSGSSGDEEANAWTASESSPRLRRFGRLWKK